MDQIRRILSTYRETGSIKATAARLRISKNTVREYLRRVRAHDTDLDTVLALSDAELSPIVYPGGGGARADRRLIFRGKVDDYLRELQRPHVTRKLLYEEYQRDFPEGYSQSQFYLHLSRAAEQRDLSLALRHEPGKTLQLDYAGDKLAWVDARSGEVHPMQVLLAVLPYSAHTFAIALPSQSTTDFVHGINEALRYFGGAPRVILSDNLKAFVKRADRYEPDFNAACVQLANHYGIELQAARVRKPKDKASVEGAVRQVYARVFAPLRDRIFHSPAQLNAALREQLELLADRPFQKRPGSRREAFETYERACLRPLPSQAFELRTTTRAKVQRNYHVELGPNHNFYSVPYQYVGQTATVVHSRGTVEIFIGAHRVATHAKRHAADRYQYQTDAAHLPRTHAEYLAAEGYDAAHFRRWAAGIGPATEWAVANVLTNKPFEAHAYRSCQGVMSLARRYGTERLERAAVRCRAAGRAGYGMLRNILERGLDRVDDQLELFDLPTHENIRGPAAYQ